MISEYQKYHWNPYVGFRYSPAALLY